MAHNPILIRELRVALRSPLTRGLAAVYLVVLAALIGWMWPREGVFSLAAQASRSLVLVATLTQLLLVILYAPAFAATCITTEKELNCYDVLFATLLRPWQVVYGKLAAAVACLMVFAALSFPLVATCFFLGAISVREAAVIYALTVASSVLFGLLGVTVSAHASSSHAALVTTYSLTLGLLAVPWIPFFLLRDNPVLRAPALLVQALSPVAALASVVVPAMEAAAAWKVYLVGVATGSVLLLALLLTRTYWAGSRPAREHGRAIDDPRELMRRKLRFPFYLIDPMRRKQSIPDWVNPIFAREMRGKAFGGGLWILRCACLCFAASLLLMALVVGNVVGYPPDAIRSVALIFQLGLVVLIAPSLTAGSVTQERERSRLDLLRMAGVGPLRFLVGKLATACMFVLFVVLGSLPAWYTIHYLGTNTAMQILTCWAIIGTTTGVALLAGLFGSAVAPRTSSATAIGYGLVFLLSIATLLPLLARQQVAGPLRDWLFAVNPFVTAIQTLSDHMFEEVGDLWRTHLRLSLGLAAALFGVAWWRVRALLGRES